MDTANQRAAQARDDHESFGRLPNDWARNPKASAECLCIVAYRCTYADDKTSFGLWEDRLSRKPILVGGFGENVRARAIAEAVALGWLDRPHNSRLPRGPGYRFARPFDCLTLPECTPDNSRIMWRGWFDGTLSRDQMATLLYLRAGTGKGPSVYARELEDRFGWSPPTTLAVLRALRSRGVVVMQREHGARGRVKGVTYIVQPDLGMQLPAAVATQRTTTKKTLGGEAAIIHKKPGDGLSGDGSPSDGLPGDKRIDSPDGPDFPRRNMPCHATLVPSGGGEPPSGSQEGMIFKQEVLQPLSPERIILANWKTSRYFRERGLRFTEKVTVALSVEEWCLWLDYFGGVPAHLKSAAAHRQASEISHELHATGRVNPPLAMVGLAYAIYCESERGRKIRSLGFIAENLIRKAEDNDDTWACDVPHRKSSEFDCAHRFATDVTEALETFHYGIELDARELLTTYRIEHLSNLIRRHGWSGLMDAINYVTENQLRQPEGSLICSWHWFSDYIEPAKAAKVAAAAAATPQNQPQPVKQGAGWDADVEAVCDWLRSHLGDAWHSSLRVSAAAKHAGIDHQIYLAAKAQLGCQKGRDSNSQWIMALPGVPALSAAQAV